MDDSDALTIGDFVYSAASRRIKLGIVGIIVGILGRPTLNNVCYAYSGIWLIYSFIHRDSGCCLIALQPDLLF